MTPAAAPHFRLLALFQLVAGLAVLPLVVANPQATPVIATCALLWLILAVVNWMLAHHPRRHALEASLYASVALISVHCAATSRAQMQVLDGLELMVLGLFAAFSLPRERVHAWLAVGSVLYLAGLLANPLSIGLWLGPVIVVMVAGTTTVVVRLIRQVQDASRRDPLTGALNRWGLTDHAGLLQAIGQRTGVPQTVVFIDLDDFKGYNDRHGHLAGDRLLVGVVEALRKDLRASDLIARIGGDEFVLVLSGVTACQAETVMARVAPRLPIACSYGVVDWDAHTDLGTAIDEADQMMYRHKQLGNRHPSGDTFEHH